VTILALDYGARRTGVAVTDASETLARPIETVERVGTPAGLETLLAIVAREHPRLIVVGLPRTPSGALGRQAGATTAFIGRFRRQCPIPIETEDERFTTALAERTPSASTRSSTDSRAAAVLLQGYLARRDRPAPPGAP
jgi:putative Holliday junction resolvase